ncbi:MAG TPA: TIGR03067 domain-containing protein [Isosphaeraceae bacterium]|jgi:uncharacterized protein (TIGR03067 family)|nr:TIGR03067 domain-containing protein [Isosphaeraceae bacterium]
MGSIARLGCGIVLVLLAVAPGRADDRAAKDEAKALRGTWRLESQEEGGRKVVRKTPGGETLHIGEDGFVIRSGDATRRAGTMTFDPSRSPKALTMVVTRGDLRGKTLHGIYELDGETLRLCYDRDGKDAPDAFRTTPGTRLVLVSYVRARAGELVDIAGTYREETPDGQGGVQVYEVVIARRRDAYMVTWKMGGQVAYVGTGVRTGDVLSVCWLNQGQAGVSSYRIAEGPTLTGHYTLLGGAGVLVPETLVPVRDKKDPDARDVRAQNAATPRPVAVANERRRR